jgi:hypothetical protein
MSPKKKSQTTVLREEEKLSERAELNAPPRLCAPLNLCTVRLMIGADWACDADAAAGYNGPFGRAGAVAAPVYPAVQVFQLLFEVFLPVRMPRHAIDPRRSIPLESLEALLQETDGNVGLGCWISSSKKPESESKRIITPRPESHLCQKKRNSVLSFWIPAKNPSTSPALRPRSHYAIGC